MNGEFILRTPPRPGQPAGEPTRVVMRAGQQLEILQGGQQPAPITVLRAEASGLLVVQWGTRIITGIVRAQGEAWTLQVLTPDPTHGQTSCPWHTIRVRPAAIDALEQTARAGSGVNGSVEIPSPIPGLVKQIKVNAGDTVEAGQTLVILEAMKMENELPAPCAGVVQSIEVKTGQSVAAGELLLKIKA